MDRKRQINQELEQLSKRLYTLENASEHDFEARRNLLQQRSNLLQEYASEYNERQRDFAFKYPGSAWEQLEPETTEYYISEDSVIKEFFVSELKIVAQEAINATVKPPTRP